MKVYWLLVFEFSDTCVPVLVTTTRPGLPLPSPFDWPPTPPTCWPQCHLPPIPHQFSIHPSIFSTHQPLFHMSGSDTLPIQPPSICLGLEPIMSVPVCLS